MCVCAHVHAYKHTLHQLTGFSPLSRLEATPTATPPVDDGPPPLNKLLTNPLGLLITDEIHNQLS